MRKVTITDIDGNAHETPFDYPKQLYMLSLQVQSVSRDGNVSPLPSPVRDAVAYFTSETLEKHGIALQPWPPRATDEQKAVGLLRELLQLVHPIPDHDE